MILNSLCKKRLIIHLLEFIKNTTLSELRAPGFVIFVFRCVCLDSGALYEVKVVFFSLLSGQCLRITEEGDRWSLKSKQIPLITQSRFAQS